MFECVADSNSQTYIKTMHRKYFGNEMIYNRFQQQYIRHKYSV